MAIITAIATTSALLILPDVHILACWIVGIVATSIMVVITPHAPVSAMQRIMVDHAVVRHKVQYTVRVIAQTTLTTQQHRGIA